MGNPAQIQSQATRPTVVHAATKPKPRIATNRGVPSPTFGPPKTYGVTPKVFPLNPPTKPRPEHCTTEQLFEIVIDVARRFCTAKDIVAEHKDYILRLKTDVFKVRFGSLGVRVPVKLNAHAKGLPLARRMHWKEFCERQFGVTADWVNRLCSGKADGTVPVDSAADENQDNGGTLKSPNLDSRQQAALVRSGMAANAIVAALKNGVDWQTPLAEYDMVAVCPTRLEEYLSALEHEPDWKLALVKLVCALELSGDKLPFIVKNAMQAARTLMGDGITRETSFPVIPYPGGKGRLAPALISFMPPKGRMYLEPFAGRGNVFWAAASRNFDFQCWWLNDLRTGGFFEAVRSIGGTVEIPARSKEEYYRQWAAFKQGDLRAKLLEPFLSFGGGGFGCGGFGGKKSADALGYTRTMRDCHKLMVTKKVKVSSLDWAKLDWCSLRDDDFVFCDPPYLGADVRPYDESDINHERLVQVLKGAKFRWMLSGYSHELYARELGQPFYAEDVQLKTTNYHQNGGKERRIECLWRNY
jgi:hypothetical protein